MRKKAIIALLVCAFILSNFSSIGSAAVESSSASMNNFLQAYGYTRGQFTDIDENKWYGENNQRVISEIIKLGLMKGSSADSFKPEGNISIAEAITIAARVHNIYYGGSGEFLQKNPWYQTYIDYALENKIIKLYDFSNYKAVATRSQMAYIFSNALPDIELDELNKILTLPDVKESDKYGKEIFKLYRAGVIMGNDIYGTFSPEQYITRAQAAAIITRVALKERRNSALNLVQVPQGLKIPENLNWSKLYTPMGKVSTIYELKKFFDAAVFNLIPSFQLNADRSIYDAIVNKKANLTSYDVTNLRITYNSGTRALTINITYSLLSNIRRIYENPSAISRISNEAKAYEAKLQSILADTITEEMSPRQKCKAIHDYMVLTYEYDRTISKGSFSFTSLIEKKVGVCQAYMELFYLLATRAGVLCEMVTGEAKDGSGGWVSHGWNKVYIDNQWFHIDVTFDDPIGGNGKVYYDYFIITDEQMAKDHRW